MIPILYDANETNFTSNGLGRLADAISCTVTETRNDSYELELTYPMDGIRFKDLDYARIILALPSDGASAQPFRIYRITKPMSGVVTVNAEHISYALRDIPVKPYIAGSASDALAGISINSVTYNPFSFWTDVATQAEFGFSEPVSARGLLGGEEGSILDQYGGEYEFDRFSVKLHAARGSDSGVTLRYGKNITDISQEINIENTVTGVLPYYCGTLKGEGEDAPEQVYMVMGDIIYAPDASSFPISRISIENVSDKFDVGEVSQVPSKAQVNAAGQEVLEEKNHAAMPAVNITISFVALWQTEEYKDIAPLERVKLCDLVTVIFEKLGISATAKVTKTVYDSLMERYDSIELGDIKQTASGLAADQIKAVIDLSNAERLHGARLDVLDDRIEMEVWDRRNADDQMNASLTMTADAITTEVNRASTAEGSLSSRITQNANAITSEVSARQTADSSNYEAVRSIIRQMANSITLDVSNGDRYANVNLGITADGQSYYKTTANAILFTGCVTFNDLATTGKTTINGGNITTGTIDGVTLISRGTVRPNQYASDIIIADGVIRGMSNNETAIYLGANGDITLSAPSTLRATCNLTIGSIGGINSILGGTTYAGGVWTFAQSMIINQLSTGSGVNLAVNTAGQVCVSASSRRWKHDISYELDAALDPRKLYGLKVCQFIYNLDKLDPLDQRYGQTCIGLIAEDVEEAYPQAVEYDKYGLPCDWSERYMIPPMLALIQEQDARIKALESEKKTLEKRIDAIEKALGI